MNGGIKLAVLVCIVCYVALRWLVRQVWYRNEHDRPIHFRHIHVIHIADWLAWLFLGAAFFLMLNTRRWGFTVLVTAGLVGCDFFLRWFFLLWEARHLRRKQPDLTLDKAKRRLSDQARREA